MKRYSRYNYKRGQAMLIAVVFFLFISLMVVLGVAQPVLKQAKDSRELITSKEAYFLAEGALEDALYRLNANKAVVSGDTLTLDGNSAQLTLVTNPSGKIITATANVDGRIRKMETEVIAGVGASFNYGIQAGVGGVRFANNSSVIGNVYVNGSITGSNGSYITGSAIAANSISQVTNQVNDTPSTPTDAIVFGNAGATQDFAQSFRVSSIDPLSKVQVYIKKSGSPSDISVKIVADNGGKPSSVVLTSGTLSSSGVTTNYGWSDILFADAVQLSTTETYWIVLDASTGSASKNYTVGANSAYASGQAKIGSLSGGTWSTTTPAGLDGYFRVYLGGTTGSITGPITIGQSGVGDARAHTVTNTTVAGTIYCQSGSGNNKSCNTTQPDPVPQPYPISEANIVQWKSEASEGGTTAGNVTISGTTMTIGPRVIEGNLEVINGSTLSVNGTLWVKGNITLSNGSIIKLVPGYQTNSGVIVSDGYININNNAQFQGSGQSNSYLLVLTTSTCPYDASCGGMNAIEVANNAGTVILNAQNGTVHFSNNAGAKEVTAYELSLDNGSQIIYSSGLANLNFSSGPSGGWNITRWQEVQ